jgi:ubiquinone/menaquinone biosynthesis C-methylase UbiE
VNPLAIEHVQKKIDETGMSNAEVMVANAAQTELPDQAFDLIFLFGLARPIGDIQAIWTELHRLSKPAGTVSVEGRLRPPTELFQPVNREDRISRFRKST